MIITHGEMLQEFRRMKHGRKATHFVIDVSAPVTLIAFDRDMPIGLKMIGQKESQ